VEHENGNPGGVKTHEEIMELFRELRQLEQNVKNPDLVVKEINQPRTAPPKIEPMRRPSNEILKEHRPFEPHRELQGTEYEKRKTAAPIVSVHKTEIKQEKKEPRSVLTKGKTREVKPEIPTKGKQTLKKKMPSQVTFTLQLDAEGNLIGFPVKKQIPQEKSPNQSGEEPAKGIKGRLLRMIPRRKSAESPSEESQGGIGSKIKGTFRRK
jgi:hypothetical protein